MRSTAKPQQPASIFHEEYHGYRIYRWFRSANGSNRLCGSQQGWMIEHKLVTDRFAMATGWNSSLRHAKAEIDKLRSLAYIPALLDDLVAGLRTDRMELLARMFPDAPNPPLALKRIQEKQGADEKQTAEKAAADAKEKALHDAAPDMLEALRALVGDVPSEALIYGSHVKLDPVAVRKALAAIAKATGDAP